MHEKLTKYPPTELISQLDDIMTSVCDEYITGEKDCRYRFLAFAASEAEFAAAPLAAAGACIPGKNGNLLYR